MDRHHIRTLLISTIIILACRASLPAQEPVPPELRSKRLLNDLQVIVAPTPSLGEDMSIGLVVRYGSVFDPIDKGGLANFLSRMFMKATADKGFADIQAELKDLGATIEIQCDWDSFRFVLRGQSAKFERSLLLLYQIVGEARFNEEDFSAEKNEILAEIHRSPDPRRKIRSQFEKSLFAGTSYGRPPEGTPKSFRAIKLGDIRYFYHRYFSPDEASLVVVGNVTPSLVLQKASRIWGLWIRKDKVPFTFLAPRPPAGRNIFLEDDPSSPAAQFIVGGLFPRRDDMAYTRAALAAHILQERLTKSLPTSLLTVGEEGRRMSGPFYIQGQAAAEQAVEEVRKIEEAVEEMKNSPVSKEELVSAQNSLIEEFNRRLITADGICGVLLDSELYRLGSNYAAGYSGQIRMCDAQAVQQAANSWILSGGEVLMFRGPASILKPALEPLGTCKQVLP